MSVEWVYIIKLLILPPSGLLLLCWVGVGLGEKKYARAVIVFSLTLLTVLSMPIMSEWLLVQWATDPMLEKAAVRQFQPQAIVVLGGGVANGKEFGYQQTVNHRTLLRLRYGAYLAKETGLPIAVTGGKPSADADRSEAEMMGQVLAQEFNIPAKWQERESRNTAENAMRCAQLLTGQGISKILLVTQGYHMPRSAWAFRQAGFSVLPAPSGLAGLPEWDSPLVIIPTASALGESFLVMHEWLGLFWYRLNGIMKPAAAS